MKPSIDFSFPQAWDAQDLTDAVPLRLFELFDFAIAPDAAATASANAATRAGCAPRRVRSYLPAAAPPTNFRVH